MCGLPPPLFRIGLVCGLLCIVLGSIWVVHLDRQIVERFSGKKWGFPSKLYSDTLRIKRGQLLEATHVWERLDKLGYRRTNELPSHKGEFYRGADYVEIYLRDFQYPDRQVSGYPLAIELDEGQIARLFDKRSPSKALAFAEIEPELIGGLYDTYWEERQIVTLDQVPQSLIDAVIITEDKRFYSHIGIDPIAVCRALLANIRARRIVQGASTLTQQFVKNYFLHNRRTMWTKIQGAVMAVLLERRYSKKEILEAYLNEIYFGQRGIQGIYGVGEASTFYFGKHVEHLTLEESALLAALIRAPSMYAPHKHPDLIRSRRNHVLKRLLLSGMITEDDYKRASNAPVNVRSHTPQLNEAPFFSDHVVEELAKDFSIDFLTSEGLRIFTTLDPELNRASQRILAQKLSDLEERMHAHLKDAEGTREPLQGCVVVIEAATGHIKALIGGRSYQKGAMNRATQAKRQPGSLFKPFVYLTALERGGRNGEQFTLTSLLNDEPLTVRYDHKEWSPRNFNDYYLGNVRFRKALEMSLNCATVSLSQKVGLSGIIATARAMGLSTPIEPLPSLVLGAFEAIPLELAAAYGALAHEGILSPPRSIKTIADREGRLLAQPQKQQKRAVSPQSAFLTTYVLKGVLQSGTARAVRDQITFPAAGKTGTTNNYQDAWFCGYTPDYVVLVWVGFDRPRSTGFTGAQAALPIWVDIMHHVVSGSSNKDFPVPSGILFKEIDSANGLLATSSCPHPFIEAFRAGTEPVEYCPLHPPEKGIPETIIELPQDIFRKFIDLFRKKKTSSRR